MTHAPQLMNEDLIFDELREVQSRTHEWGRKNQVEFDPSKEFFCIIHPSQWCGDDVKILGSLFDCPLSMQPCIDGVLSKIRLKIRAIVRLAHVYSPAKLVSQYKCHIWGLREYSNGAIILAAPSQLKRLDKVQRGFLQDIGMTDTETFVVHNFAPPSLRRCIGLLGLLHKRVLGKYHPGLAHVLPFAEGLQADYHSKALHPYSDMQHYQARLYRRSLFAYVLIYNRLPQALVDLPSVKCFQSKLTHLAKHRAQIDQEGWRSSFQNCEEIVKMFYSNN